MSQITSVLLDITGIQSYVFASNKLRENAGASLLVSEVYQSFLRQALKSVFPQHDFSWDAWQENPGQIDVESSPFEIGYIGGGNALLFFQEKDKAMAFVREWSSLLLVDSPGLTTAVASAEMDGEDLGNRDIFPKKRDALFESLQRNKGRFAPVTLIPQHGITGNCPHTPNSMEVWNKDEEKYLSCSAHAKLEASEASREKWEKDFSPVLGEKYRFTNDLGCLGQKKHEDSHIAIVHVDANDMGQRFEETRTLVEMRNLSLDTKRSLQKSFASLLGHIDERFEEIQDALGFEGNDRRRYPIDKGSGKYILPIRPVVLEGDDVTFVCDGKLGLYFAKILLEAWEKENSGLTACAGVSIIKTKYPFYRGYQLAEELCRNAKNKRKSEKQGGSWIDFHLAYGGISGSLAEIREKQYQVQQGNLLFRPYCLSRHDEKNFGDFVDRTRALRKQDFPNSKLKELREVLTLGGEAASAFLQEEKIRGRKFPEIADQEYHEKLFANSRTPYFDMLELMELYPKFELDKKKRKGE